MRSGRLKLRALGFVIGFLQAADGPVASSPGVASDSLGGNFGRSLVLPEVELTFWVRVDFPRPSNIL